MTVPDRAADLDDRAELPVELPGAVLGDDVPVVAAIEIDVAGGIPDCGP